MSEMWSKKSLEQHQNVDEAQYMMGLCEFQLGRLESATQWFDQAGSSSNSEVRGKATAMLGIISSSKGDFDEARAQFAIAATELTGRDKREAIARSGSPIQQETGDWGSTYFTLQFGAYRDQTNAKQAVHSISNSLNEHGLGEPWILEETDRFGRTMFLVQAGRFSTRVKASTLRKSANLPQCIVATVP